jgi:DNA recombination protein RmuC
MTLVYFIIILAVLVLSYILLRRFLEEKLTGKGDNALIMLQNQIAELNRTMDAKLGESSKELREEMSKSAKMAQDIIKEVTRELTKIGESHKQVVSITDQLKSLQDILKNPKQRGVLGETMLTTVLQNVLPPGTYQTQYPFSNGEIVDAVIFFGGKVIPIDAKFSLENYSRILTAANDADRKRYEDAFRTDLKNRIDEVCKYIKPSEDTYDFAFMFIPSEAIYYDLLVNKIGAVSAQDLVEYAGNKKVTIVSPTTLVAYLNTILQGLKQIEFNKSAEQIRKKVEDLRKHIGNYEIFIKKVGTHLGTTVNAYNQAYKELNKIDKDVVKITGKEIGTEQLTLEQPLFDEE